MLVIFDMDGTLTESSTLLANSINYVRSKLNLERLSKDIIIEQINNPDCNMAEFFYNLNEIEPIHEEWFSYYYSNNHDKEQELFNGVVDMLKRLKQKDIKLAIATNAYKESAIETLTYLKIIDYFDEIVGFNDVKEGKPSPLMLNKIVSTLNKKPSDVIFIGDSSRDKLAAKSANIEFIGVDFRYVKADFSKVVSKIEEYFCII